MSFESNCSNFHVKKPAFLTPEGNGRGGAGHVSAARLGAAERDLRAGSGRDWEQPRLLLPFPVRPYMQPKLPGVGEGSSSWGRLECGVLRKREEGAGAGTRWSGLEPLGLGNNCKQDKAALDHFVCTFS